jgi:iron(III) transport system substrate-binding protein
LPAARTRRIERTPVPARRLLPLLIIALLVTAGATLAACGGSDSATSGATGSGDGLVVYSGREEELVAPLYEQFTAETGIKLDVRYGDSAELAATLLEEGDATPAQVFYAQDAGSIGVIEDRLAELPASDLDLIPARYRDPAGRWTGVTGRVRVLIYNTERVDAAKLPDSVLPLGDKDWPGDVGVAPTNASFVGFVSAMREELGDEQTAAWLSGLSDHARTYEKNSQIVDAVASGEVDTGLVNHYYLYEKLGSDPETPIANHYFAPGDVGSFVNVSAVGILAGASGNPDAEAFVTYLLTKGQVFFANDAEEREYPLNASEPGMERAEELPPLDDNLGPDVNLADLSKDLEGTVKMIRDAGLIM